MFRELIENYIIPKMQENLIVFDQKLKEKNDIIGEK